MNKRPLAVIAAFFIFGIVLARFLPDSIKFFHIVIATLIFILFSFIFSRDGTPLTPTLSLKGRGRIANGFLFLSIVSFALLLYLNSNTFPNNHIGNVLKEENLKTEIVGIIRSPALTRKPYYGKISSTYVFEIEGIKGVAHESVRSSLHNAAFRPLIQIQGLAQIRIQTEEDYRYGDRLLVRGTIRNPKQIQNSKSQRSHFNYGKYLEKQNIFALINTKEHNVTILSHNYKSNPVLKYTYLIREKLKNQFIDKMPLDSGAFLRAILLGDRSELPKDIQASFKNSGTMHILPTQCRGKYNYTPKSHVTLCKSVS